MAAQSLRPEAGARFHQFVLGTLPVVGYLANWELPVWVTLALSMISIVSVRFAVIARLWNASCVLTGRPNRSSSILAFIAWTNRCG